MINQQPSCSDSEMPSVHAVPGLKLMDVGQVSSTSSTSEQLKTRSDFVISSSTKDVDDAFNTLYRRAQEAIHLGLQPDLIQGGSSGSYFVKDETGRYVGVFKPRDEEPFAPLNPKWPKYFQKIMCFCCFGRACLIPNSGYLSEAGASLVDEMLGLSIVPATRVVKLASPSFYYERRCLGCIRREVDDARLPPKEGSFQVFVRDFEPANTVLARWDYDRSLLSEEERTRFIMLFQKMVVLDYVIRNTDRHNDNWMIKHVPGKELELVAIDHGLAFPVKHPEVISRLRSFPFKWQFLKYAQEPWNEGLRVHLLTKLTPLFVHDMCREIHKLFRHGVGIGKQLTNNQLKVVRGQLRNLRTALVRNLPPSEMAKLEPLLVRKRGGAPAPTIEADPDDWSPFFKEKKALQVGSSCCCACCC